MMEKRMHLCMRFLLQYNDYIVCIFNIELIFLAILSKPQVEWRSDQPRPNFIHTDFVDIILCMYLNLLFMKQIIQHLYYDFAYSKAVQEANFFTVNIGDLGAKKDTSLKISPMRSLASYLYYFIIDFILILLI